MYLIDIEVLKRLNVPNKIVLTRHAKERLIERNITITDIINGIETGEVIKQYASLDKDSRNLLRNMLLSLTDQIGKARRK